MDKKSFKSRKNPRIKTVVTASFKSNDPDDQFKEGVITNFSRTGFFIETVFVFPVNTQIVIDVFLPDEDKIRLKEFFDLNHIYGWFC